MKQLIRKIKRFLSLLLSGVLLLAMCIGMSASAHAGHTVTIKAPDGLTLDGMTVTAYKVLNGIYDETNTGGEILSYETEPSFNNFFSNAKDKYFSLGETPKKDFYLYFGNNSLQVSEDPISDEPSIHIEVTDTKELNMDYFESDLLDRIRQNGGNDVLTMAGWLNNYVEKSAIETPAELKKTAGTSASSIEFSNLEDGYYLFITDTYPENISVKRYMLYEVPNDTEKDGVPVPIQLKAEKDETIKEVKNPNQPDTTYAQSATASIGTSVDYKVTMPLPTLVENELLDQASVEDTLSNQQVNPNSFRLQIGETTYTNAEKKAELSYGTTTIASVNIASYDTTKKEQNFTITFNTKGLEVLSAQAQTPGASAILEYSATLTQDAVHINPNKVSWTYTNGPYNYIGKGLTDVYTYGIELKKTFSDGSGAENYPNVIFRMFANKTDSENPEAALYFTGSDGIYKLATSDTSGATQDLKLNPQDGMLKIYGFGEGTYFLSETKAPEGFNKLELIQVILKTDGADFSALSETASSVTVNGQQLNAVKYTTSDNDLTAISFEAYNQKGFNLPQTGDVGIWTLTIGGLVLIAIGCAALIALRRTGRKH